MENVQTFGAIDLKDALVLVAAPTTGSAAPIAAHYLVRHFALKLHGQVRLRDLEGVIAIQDGRATSAVRIYGGDVPCRLERECPRIYIVTTEIPLSPSAGAALAESIGAWAKKGGAHLVLSLEAVVRAEGDLTPDVFCASADERVLKTLRKLGLRMMDRALIGGITSHLLMSSQAPTAALIVEASRDHPDGHAAAALLEAFSLLAPQAKLDAEPLRQEAQKLEDEIRKAQADAARQAAGQPHTPSFI
jgi:predicted ATP-grasp superfamily ATP-dependent carboligase